MADKFKRKALLEISEVNQSAKNPKYIEECEADYASRLAAAADAITAKGASIVMLSGPSASGKTTSSKKLAAEFKTRGVDATVVSLDDFFKSINEYPKTPDGAYDMEHVKALDIERIHTCLNEIIETGRSELPIFDFVHQRPSEETRELKIKSGDVLIVEGIHALNPLLTETVKSDRIFKIYAGLRTEYAVEGERLVSTREIRITRRLIRDYYFRGNSVRDTLDYWKQIQRGEEVWIKPFKVNADLLLNTSLEYEPCVTRPMLRKICEDQNQGGDYRNILMWLNDELFAEFSELDVVKVPNNSVIREFYGGLIL